MTDGEEFRAYMKAANSTSSNEDDRHLSEASMIAYCRGEISEADHEAAQAHLVACESCIALFRNARDFLEPAAAGEGAVSTVETNEAWQSLWERVNPVGEKTAEEAKSTTTVLPVDFQRPREQRFFSPRRISMALAAGLVLSIAGLGWLGWRLWQERQARQQSQAIAIQLEKTQRELEQRLSQLEQTGDHLKQEREQRRAAEAERDQLHDLLAQAQPSRANVPLFTFRLSSERGADDNLPLKFNHGVQAVRLRLFVNKPYEFPEYALELIDARGKVVREISKLRPASNDGALSARLNRAKLSTGNYRLRLLGQRGETKQPVGEYGLAVTVR